MAETRKIPLPESELPTHWYNIAADMKRLPPPPLHPATHQPIGPEALAPLFPMALIQQEVSTERYIPIPEEVREVYKLWRPTPLYRARALEKALDTPAHIYYKYEGVSPSGSHKPNTAVAQAYYNAQEGVKRITTETGAGQWGSSLAFACQLFGIECKVYMVRISYEQKPYRRVLMETWGAKVVPSPSPDTNAGRAIVAEDPNSTGSLGIAISEAVEDAASREVQPGKRAQPRPPPPDGGRPGGDEADGAGWRVSGRGHRLRGRGIERRRADVPLPPRASGGPAEDPLRGGGTGCLPVADTLTKGEYRYDFGDTAGLTPLLKMYTLGHTFVPPGIHAGGLRYHAMAPLICQLYHDGEIEAIAYPQTACFEAAVLFARCEGIVPAPESSHAVRAAIDEALAAREAGERRVILFNLSGHGLLDLQAYDDYMAGKLRDEEYPAEKVKEAMKHLPEVE